MTGQSRRLQQVPYGRRKLKLQKKKTISLKIYLLIRFFEINTLNFQEMFLIILRIFYQKDFAKISKLS